MAYSVSLIIFMAAAVILLFAVMVTSAQAAGKAYDKTCTQADGKTPQNDCQKECHKYSTITAITAGVTTAVVIIGLILYLYTNKSHISADATALQNQMNAFSKGMQSSTQGSF